MIAIFRPEVVYRIIADCKGLGIIDREDLKLCYGNKQYHFMGVDIIITWGGNHSLGYCVVTKSGPGGQGLTRRISYRREEPALNERIKKIFCIVFDCQIKHSLPQTQIESI